MPPPEMGVSNNPGGANIDPKQHGSFYKDNHIQHPKFMETAIYQPLNNLPDVPALNLPYDLILVYIYIHVYSLVAL